MTISNLSPGVLYSIILSAITEGDHKITISVAPESTVSSGKITD